MTQTINIRKGEKIIRLNFTYNADLVDIMHSHNGWFFRKEKSWQFPIGKFEEVYDHLKKEKYSVNITKLDESKDKPEPKHKLIQTTWEEYWKDKDTIAVGGTCKKCKEWHFVNKDKVCMRCSE